jgi:hypothetical protein
VNLRHLLRGNTILVFAIGIVLIVGLALALYLGLRPAPSFSKTLETSDLQTNYARIKDVMRAYVDATAPDIDQRTRAQRVDVAQFGLEAKQPFYNLAVCTPGRAYIPTGAQLQSPDDGLLIPLADLALETATWAHYLAELRYPQHLWQVELTTFETRELNTIAGASVYDAAKADSRAQAFANALSTKLAAYQRVHPATNAVIVWPNCGRADFSRVVTVDPPNGELRVIPQLLYDLCSKIELDPDSPKSCDRWTVQSSLQRLAGGYRYVVQWPDGVQRCGHIGTDSESDRIPLTLRKSVGTTCAAAP